MNEAITYIRELLLSREGLLITADAYAAAVIETFPLHTTVAPTVATPPSYADSSKAALEILLAENPIEGVTLTREFASAELPPSSIAYHRIKGFITSSSNYYFSTKQFEKELLLAEDNPSISCHLFHVCSGGGEAWYLDRLSETIQQLQKPILTLFEKIGGSAAYYIGCQADHVYAMTSNDSIGCIGTMVDTYNWDGYFEKLGIKRVLARAHQSDLKNKKVEDLLAGNPEQYITDVLDPLNAQFIACVRANRSKLAKAPDDEPALRGETYMTDAAIEVGLIDGKRTFEEAVMEAKQLADEFNNKKKALNIFNS